MERRGMHLRTLSFESGDEQYLTYSSQDTSRHQSVSGRGHQNSSSGEFSDAPRQSYQSFETSRPGQQTYSGNYSQYIPAPLSPGSNEYDEPLYSPGAYHHQQQPSLSLSEVSYSSYLPSPPPPPPHRELPVLPHRPSVSSQRAPQRSTGSSAGTAPRRPLPIPPLHSNPSEEIDSTEDEEEETNGYNNHNVKHDDDDDRYICDDIIEDLENSLNPISEFYDIDDPTQDPEAFLFRTPSTFVNDRGTSIRSAASRRTQPYESNGADLDVETTPPETSNATPIANTPFMISGFAPGQQAAPGSMDDDLEDPETIYDDYAIFGSSATATANADSTPRSPSVTLSPSTSSAGNSTRPDSSRIARHSAYGRQFTPRGSVSQQSSGSFDQLNNGQRLPSHQMPGRSISAVTRSSAPRNESSLQRWNTDVPDIRRSRYSDVELDLPTIPAGRKQLDPSKLSTHHYKQCPEPWALSCVVDWLKEISQGDTDLRGQSLVNALAALFSHKVPTMRATDAEALAYQTLEDMLTEGVLIKDEEWMRFTSLSLSGVLWQLTGQGCYSSRVHVPDDKGDVASGRCYSRFCMKSLKNIDLQSLLAPERQALEWHEYWELTPEFVSGIERKEQSYQNAVHEVANSAYKRMRLTEFAGRDIVDELNATRRTRPVIERGLSRFIKDVFSHFLPIAKVMLDHLIVPLRMREAEQGPLVTGVSDIARDFIKKAKPAFLAGAAALPKTKDLFRKQCSENLSFAAFAKQLESKAPGKVGWGEIEDAFRQFTMSLLPTWETMRKSCSNPTEQNNIAKLSAEWKEFVSVFESKYWDAQRFYDPIVIMRKLRMRPAWEHVQLNLDQPGRELIHQGTLTRTSAQLQQSLEIYGMLLDNCLIFAKVVKKGASNEYYDVNRPPIPISLLVLESRNDLPVYKSLVGTTPVTRERNGAVPGAALIHGAGQFNVSIDTSGSQDRQDKVDPPLYPFKVKHMGLADSYTLYANSEKERKKWCDEITRVQTRYVNTLRSTGAEPFRLRVLADTAFAYDNSTPLMNPVLIENTALHDALREVHERYAGNVSQGLPICRSQVNCATVFTENNGDVKCVIGTNSGLYISDYDDPRGWKKVDTIPSKPVMQVAVMEQFDLMVLILDGYLLAYQMALLNEVNPPANMAAQKLISNNSVGFFKVGKIGERFIVLCPTKNHRLESRFRLLEPVLQQTAPSRRFFPFHRKQMEHFRVYEDFYHSFETFNANVLDKSIGLATQRGFAFFNTEKRVLHMLNEFKVSDPDPALRRMYQNVSEKVQGRKPLGMFKLSDNDFLLAFNKWGIVIDNTGAISRSALHEFAGEPTAACMYGKYLILVHDQFVEIVNAIDGRQRQVILGRDIRLLDDGECYAACSAARLRGLPAPGGSIKISMQHPQSPRNMLVLELVEKDL